MAQTQKRCSLGVNTLPKAQSFPVMHLREHLEVLLGKKFHDSGL